MAVSVRIARGPAELRRAAADLRRAHRTDITRRTVAAIERALTPVAAAIRAEVPVKMPSGYAPVLSASLHVDKSVRTTRNPTVSLRVWAMGKVVERDVEALDDGRLRHPVYGNRDVWRTTSRPPGLVSQPWSEAEDDIVRAVDDALDQIVRDLERG